MVYSLPVLKLNTENKFMKDGPFKSYMSIMLSNKMYWSSEVEATSTQADEVSAPQNDSFVLEFFNPKPTINPINPIPHTA